METKGLKINCLGASNTRIIKTVDGITVRDVNYPVILGLILRCTVRNYGLPGSNIAVTPDRSDSYAERVAGMEKDADLVILQGWGNDARHGVPIGRPADLRPDTYIGALELCILNIEKIYPRSKLILLSGFSVRRSTKRLGDGLPYEEFAEAFFETGRRFGCEPLDFYSDSRFDPDNPEALPDGIHMSEKTCRIYSDKVADLIRDL